MRTAHFLIDSGYFRSCVILIDRFWNGNFCLIAFNILFPTVRDMKHYLEGRLFLLRVELYNGRKRLVCVCLYSGDVEWSRIVLDCKGLGSWI